MQMYKKYLKSSWYIIKIQIVDSNVIIFIKGEKEIMLK